MNLMELFILFSPRVYQYIFGLFMVLIGLTHYHLLERRNEAIPLTTFFRMADQEGVHYIVSDALKNVSYKIPLTAPAHIGSHIRIFQDQYTSIYERQ